MSGAGSPSPRPSPQGGEGDVGYNRLRWHCQRGMLELDHILRGFLDTAYRDADAETQAAFAELLALDDVDILDLIAGQATPATAGQARLLGLLRLKDDLRGWP